MTEDSNLPPIDSPGTLPPPARPGHRTPADYYSGPSQASAADKKGCKWLALGCGGAGCLGGIVIVALLVWLAGPGLGKATAFVLHQVENEARGQVFDELPPEVREEFSEQVEKLTLNLREGTLSNHEIQGLLFDLQGAIGDQKITPDEIESLLSTMKELNGDLEGEVSF